MERLGTQYGGWKIPINSVITEDSIIYSVGVGEDISFDIALVDKYNCNIFLIDPTAKSIEHFNEFKLFSNDQTFKFTGNIQPDYYSKIKNKKYNLNKMHYIDIGVWNEKSSLKFYKQSNENYVSQSLIPHMFTDNYDIVNVDTIKNIMDQHNHSHIDLLKLDIEGAEIDVLNNMLDNLIFPTYLCIEFDLALKKKDQNNSTDALFNRLADCNYEILCNDDLNVTFKHVL